MTPFHLLVLAIAVFRITRLVTGDSISEGFREWLRSRSHRDMAAPKGLEGEMVFRTEERTDRPVMLWAWRLLTCPWCVSMYAGGLAIGLFLSYPTYTLDVGYVLACSAVAGVLMERT